MSHGYKGPDLERLNSLNDVGCNILQNPIDLAQSTLTAMQTFAIHLRSLGNDNADNIASSINAKLEEVGDEISDTRGVPIDQIMFMGGSTILGKAIILRNIALASGVDMQKVDFLIKNIDLQSYSICYVWDINSKDNFPLVLRRLAFQIIVDLRFQLYLSDEGIPYKDPSPSLSDLSQEVLDEVDIENLLNVREDEWDRLYTWMLQKKDKGELLWGGFKIYDGGREKVLTGAFLLPDLSNIRD